MNMKNMAYTSDYQAYRKEQEAVFCAENCQSEETLVLGPHYHLKRRSYQGEVGGYSLHATENDLVDEAGILRYTYRNLNDNCEFQTLIVHNNGYNYLIFRTDLYGYSILNLTTYQDFHYMPSDSFPQGETFIWTGVFYNPKNNLLAISGCYWACPMGTLLQDFSDPLEEPQVWVDVQSHLDKGYDRYDDVNLLAWQGTDLVLDALDCESEAHNRLILSILEYGPWLAEKWA